VRRWWLVRVVRGEPRVELLQVEVLAWHESSATVVTLEEGAQPMRAKHSDLYLRETPPEPVPMRVGE
jgi:hypothetical protein